MSITGLSQHGGHATVAISKVFYNSRDRQKHLGKKGSIVVDMCSCTRSIGTDPDTGEDIRVPVPQMYFHDGKTCGGHLMGAYGCEVAPLDFCAEMAASHPDNGEEINLMVTPPVIPPVVACEILNQVPYLGADVSIPVIEQV